jgi:hypothetical protein
MVKAQSQTVIKRPAERVFQFIAVDFFQNYPRWSPEVVALQATSTGPVQLGTTGRQVRIDQGRRTESTFRVSRYEVGRQIAFQGAPTPFHITYALAPLGDDTRLTFTFELSHLEFFMRPFEKLIRLAMQDGAEQVTRNLKSLIEAESAATGSQALKKTNYED